jgi:hypothetical protein
LFLRLRQICLVARQLEPIAEDLKTIFDLEVCYRDPLVAAFGVHNVLLPFGTSFLEIVAPVRENTAAERYLVRRNGDGGYMTIFDSDELGRWRKHASSLGVREAMFFESEFFETDGFQILQLDPRDTGGALLEINRAEGGANLGIYPNAGRNWRDQVRTGTAQALVGVELQSDEPEQLAARWGGILLTPVTKVSNAEWRLSVDNATVRFVPINDDRGEGLGGVDVQVREPDKVKDIARERGLTVSRDFILIGGVRFNIEGPAR